MVDKLLPVSLMNQTLFRRLRGVVYETTLRRQRSIFVVTAQAVTWPSSRVLLHRLTLNCNHTIVLVHDFRGQPRTTQCAHVCQTLFRRLRGVVYETTLRRQRSIFVVTAQAVTWPSSRVLLHRLTLNCNHTIVLVHDFRGQPRTTQCAHVCQTLFCRLRGVVYETTFLLAPFYSVPDG